MTDSFVCWKCGTPLVDLILPMSRREECVSCKADQHACMLCQHFVSQTAGGSAGDCKEDRAEHITDRERSNFCDYFSPKPNAYSGGFQDTQTAAEEELRALFGDEQEESESTSTGDAGAGLFERKTQPDAEVDPMAELQRLLDEQDKMKGQ